MAQTPAPTGGEVAEAGDADEDAGGSFIDRAVDRVDEVQRRVPPLAVAFAVSKKYGEDEGSQLAMLIAYRGFFSIFPLLLALVNVLGIALRNNPSLRSTILDSTLSNIPVVGTQVATGSDELTGSWLLLSVAAVLSVWSGLGLLAVLGAALNRIWDVAVFDRPSWVVRQLRSIGAAVVVGVCAMVSGLGAWAVTTDLAVLLRVVASAVFPLVAGAAAYLGLHQILCVRKVPFKSQLPGMAATALVWWGLLSLGGAYVERVVSRSSDTYGVFAVVLGLLSWSYLLGMLYLYCVSLAAVLAGRRWPRSLSGRNLTEPDRSAVERIVERGVTVRGTQVDVSVPDEPAVADERS